MDIINLINGIIKEQSFSAIASSYLKEAHAIAYLDGTLAYMNRKMRQFANLDSQKFNETDLFSLLERFKTDIFTEPSLAIRRVLQTNETYQSELYFPETNKTLNMQISLVKVPSDNASIHETNIAMIPACLLITFTDISAVKENEKLRSDMTSLMSHELRTPVASIKGFAELLLFDETIPFYFNFNFQIFSISKVEASPTKQSADSKTNICARVFSVLATDDKAIQARICSSIPAIR